jgi:hypothetical protein
MADNYADTDALELLKRLKSEAFTDSVGETALVLGRPQSEVDDWLSGAEQIDEDAEMKIRGIAQERLGGE